MGKVVQCYSGDHGRAMVFLETKKNCDQLALAPEIKQQCSVLHGDIAQNRREAILKVSGITQWLENYGIVGCQLDH